MKANVAKYGIYKNGKLKKTYTDAGKAVLALAMVKEIQPEQKWEVKPIAECRA